MKRHILSLSLPLVSEIMTTVRLATGGVCSLAGLDIDDSEDCKVCVTESLLLLMHAGYAAATVEFSEEDGELAASIKGAGDAAQGAPMPEDEISAALISALAESVTMEKSEGALSSVSFRFAK